LPSKLSSRHYNAHDFSHDTPSFVWGLAKYYLIDLPETERWLMAWIENYHTKNVTKEKLAEVVAKIVERCDNDKGKAHRLKISVEKITEILSARAVFPFTPDATCASWANLTKPKWMVRAAREIAERDIHKVGVAQ
jgi:hypothetical protein